MPRIFISYRRSDSGTFTGRIQDRLSASFGADNVFRDVYDIPAGSDFRTILSEEVGSTDVCLVIIGPTWMNVTNAQGQPRLADPDDFVRIEVESALRNPNTLVIPVLVDGAVMPAADALPSGLTELAYRNAVQVRADPDFPHDMEVLIRQIKRAKAQRPRALIWLSILLLLLLIPGYFLYASMQNKVPAFTPTLGPTATATEFDTATQVPFTPTALVEPVGADEVMILVAQMEAIGSQPRDATHFIVDDLTRRFETEKLVANVRIREYGEVIQSNADAQAVAEQTGALIVIWGKYEDDVTTVNMQIGSLKSFPNLALDRATIERIINIRLQMTNERQQTLAYPIVGALGALLDAGNDFVGTMRLIVSLDQLDAPKPEIVGNSVAAHYYNATLMFISDPQTAVNELTQAIELDASNPFLYAFRAVVNQGSGQFQLGRQDSDTAIRLAPEGWVIPYYIRGNESLITNELTVGIDAYSQVIEIRPDDWYPYNMRGYLYFLAHQYEEARADIDKSIALGPEAEWPYMWGMLIALRQGRLSDVPAYSSGILDNPAKNPVFVQRLMTATMGQENATLVGYSMASIGHFSIGQFDVSAEEADMVLSVAPNYAEMYLLKGLSYCNIDEYQKAEAAYSTGLEVDPTFSMLYFLRAEVRTRLGDTDGAAADLAHVAESDIAEILQPWLEAGQSGERSCKDITAIN